LGEVTGVETVVMLEAPGEGLGVLETEPDGDGFDGLLVASREFRTK
jgi:hypothetical protein